MSRPTKTMPTHTKLRTSAMAAAVTVALSCLPGLANAAGLGRLTVYSGLGQPLRAEIELTASREELAGMAARLAPPDAFRQAGVDYASTLLGLRFAVDKRPDGKSVVRLSSDRPISDPYVDLLLELNWPSGRLVREYTFLLDPPEVAAKAAPSVATVEAKIPAGSRPQAVEEQLVEASVPAAPAASAKAAAAAPGVAPAEKRVVRGKAEPVKAAPATPAEPVKAAGDGAKVVATRPVKAGDNLRKIAEETRPEGVSLEQMLVGLFRANQDAFAGGNMNRLRTGAIIGVPDQETLAAIPQEQAKKVFIAQAQDWNNYRRKLAAAAADAPARDESAGQTAAGRVTAKVEDKAKPASEAKDQVKVAKTEPGKAGKGALEEDLIAKDKALNEANQRLATLEKNVAELQKLLALKSQNLADLQKQATAKPEEKKPEPAKAPEIKPEPKPDVKPEAKVEAKPDAVPATPPAAAESADKPAQPASEAPAEAPKPVEPPKPVPPPPPPPVVAEPSMVDSLLGDPLPVAGLGGIVALLLGWLFYKRRRAAAETVESDIETPPLMPSMPKPDSQPPVATGEAVKTPLTDFSQAGPGTIDTDEVDLVAEADVYIAYGRDAQAEEILLEAQQKDPTRVAIPAKLLEIYAKRQDNASYEAVARVLQSLTGGVGPDWDKAVQQGAALDPANPLYAAAEHTAEEPVFDADATLLDNSPATSASDDLVSLDFDLPATPAEAMAAPEQAPLAAAADEAGALDFNIEAAADQEAPAESPLDTATLDFDLDAAGAAPVELAADTESSTNDNGNALDFDFELPGEAAEEAAPAESFAAEPAAVAEAAPAPAPAGEAGNIMDFDFDLAGSSAATEQPVESDNSASLDFKLPDLDLPDVGADAAKPADVTEDLMPAEDVVETTASSDQLSDFDFDLPASTAAVEVESAAAEETIELPELAATEASPAEMPAEQTEPTLPSFDLSSINLDLDSPEAELPPAAAPEALIDFEPVAETAAEPAAAEEINLAELAAFELPEMDAAAEAPADLPAVSADEPVNQEVETKLDLAKAYEEMGDQEGARELLEEVLAEGSASQQDAARALLARMA